MRAMNLTHCERRNPTSLTGIVLGLLLVAVGVVYLLVQLDVVSRADAVLYWPAAIGIVGLVKLLPRRSTLPDRIFGLLLLAAAGLLQAHLLGYLTLSWSVIWPLLLVGAGLHVVVGSLWLRRQRDRQVTVTDGLDEQVVFGGRKARFEGSDFRGGQVCATFGGVELDLTDADFPGDEVTLDCRALFGGVEIAVPRTWRVVLKGSAMFGAFEDKTRPHGAEVPAKTLVVTGSALFGAVELKH